MFHLLVPIVLGLIGGKLAFPSKKYEDGGDVDDMYAKGGGVSSKNIKRGDLVFAKHEGQSGLVGLVLTNPKKAENGTPVVDVYFRGYMGDVLEESIDDIEEIIEGGHLYIAENKNDIEMYKSIASKKNYYINERYNDIDSEEYAKGGGVSDYSNKFKEVYDSGDECYYIRNFGKVSTNKKDNVQLLVVANIKNLEGYVSEEELPSEGNYQLEFYIVPELKYIAKKHKDNADDENSSISDNGLVNIVNYMGGLNYSPSEKVFFKTSEQAVKHLMSKELNDRITADGVMSGFIMDKKYNRIGQTNWDYLAYMMGEIKTFAKGGGVKGYDENTEMVLNQNKQIAHHTKELEKAAKGKHAPAWVVAKVNSSADDLSDATHYMDGAKAYKKGGEIDEEILTYEDFQVKIRKNSKWKRWEGLHRAINPKTKEPMQKWGLDKDSMVAETKEELMKMYAEKYKN